MSTLLKIFVYEKQAFETLLFRFSIFQIWNHFYGKSYLVKDQSVINNVTKFYNVIKFYDVELLSFLVIQKHNENALGGLEVAKKSWSRRL